MASLICILGRQPNLGLAELESLYSNGLEPFADNSAVLNGDDKSVDLRRLGGTQKICLILKRSSTTNWVKVKSLVKEALDAQLVEPSDSKIKLGLSLYNFNQPIGQIQRDGLDLKKHLRSRGYSVRVVPNQKESLSTAQVIHNQLSSLNGFEIVCINNGEETIIAKTISVQDIADYSLRDFARPMRDAKIGMLPPKLAQIMINLTTPIADARLLDPFCGTGVILQEALLAGFEAYGTDINPKMVDYSKENLKWLASARLNSAPNYEVDYGDATKYKWDGPIGTIVSEIYLGKPLLKQIEPSELDKEVQEVNTLLESFLENLAKQIKSGTPLCLAVPAWRVRERFVSLPVLDHLSKIGYNHVSFKTVNASGLLYYRPNQFVARKLLVLVRK